jgi:hypothetical protein
MMTRMPAELQGIKGDHDRRHDGREGLPDGRCLQGLRFRAYRGPPVAGQLAERPPDQEKLIQRNRDESNEGFPLIYINRISGWAGIVTELRLRGGASCGRLGPPARSGLVLPREN